MVQRFPPYFDLSKPETDLGLQSFQCSLRQSALAIRFGNFMELNHALHTVARRYCQQKNSEWSQSYQELQGKEQWQVENLFEPGWDYSPEAYAIFPRYRLDSAIQAEIEKLRPDACSDRSISTER